MKEKHLFYRKITIQYGEIDREYSIFCEVDEKSNISSILHSVFNFDAGDVYAWPVDNITKEELDNLWKKGQRSFIFNFGYKTVIYYDLKIVTNSEWKKIDNVIRIKREQKRIDIINLIQDEVELDISSIVYLNKKIDEILNENIGE